MVRGKEDVIKLAVVSLLARGHLLLEDVPGVGKTTLARALAASIGVSFRRLQCTSDLMPTDVLGGNVFNQSTSTFEFRAGPIFTQVLLADEVNRTTPKTQSALLEAMDERQVSIDGETHDLDDPFFVVATQNPQEFYGTYPLPESQLDRFLVRMSIGYPPPEVEREVLSRRSADPVQKLSAVMSATELRHVQQAVDSVQVDDAVLEYLHRIVVASRNTPLPLRRRIDPRRARLRACHACARPRRGTVLRAPGRREGARRAGPCPPGEGFPGACPARRFAMTRSV